MKIFRSYLLISSFAAAAFFGCLNAAGAPKKSVLDVKESITDSNIIFPESFESDSHKMLEGWYMKNYTATDDRYERLGDVPTSDAVYRQRLAELPTKIDLPYNQIVKSYIERYTVKGRPMVAGLLGLSNYYMPIFEQALEEAGLPLELKYLPVVESALDPTATSRHGAAGLWQFMLIAAKGLDMEVNSLVDERRDPYISSKKAAKFLGDLYKTYGDWSLAIAAYNCGPGSVNKALRRAGGDPKSHDFWSIYSYLPAETRGYVPMFIAANYVMNYYNKHNISPVVPTRPLVTDTLHINRRLHLKQISDVLDIPMEELRILNPQFRADIIPGTASKSYNLILPSQQIHAYLMSEEDIVNHEADKYARRVSAEPNQLADNTSTEGIEDSSNVYADMADAPTVSNVSAAQSVAPTAPAVQESRPIAGNQSGTTTHKVAPGESLADIAARYGVSPEDIKNWNHLRRNSLRTGQVLRIAGTPGTSASGSVAETVTVPRTARQASRQAAVAAETPRRTTPSAASRSKAKADAKASAAKAESKSSSSKKSSKKETVKKQAAKPAAPTTHTVQSGDSYERIARKHGVSTEELMKANGASSTLIKPGQSLKIPTKKGASTKAASSKSTSSKSKKKKKK